MEKGIVFIYIMALAAGFAVFLNVRWKKQSPCRSFQQSLFCIFVDYCLVHLQ